MPSMVHHAPSWCVAFHEHYIIGPPWDGHLYSDCRFCGRRYVGPKPTVEEFRTIRRMIEAA